VVALGLLGVALSEGLQWRASRSSGSRVTTGTSYGLVVLGYHSKRNGGGVHPIQRWRVQIAMRSFVEDRCARIVFSGGSRGAGPSEADVMAALAVSLGIAPDVVVLEESATTTAENVERSLPLVGDCDVIAFCSDPMHAARARRHARGQRPDLAGRFVGADDFRLFERWWLKLPATAYELTIGARNRLRTRKWMPST